MKTEAHLADLCIPDGIQTGPFGSQLHQSDYSDAGTPVIMPVNLVDGEISENGIARVEIEHVERLNKYVVHEGDIVYARRGDVGRCSQISDKEDGWLCGTGCLRITADTAKINPRYLFYALSMPQVIGWVRNNAKGTTMPNLNTEILSSVPLAIDKDLNKQTKIVSILSAYDSLIKNNRKQIRLLEEAAQRLYKEWFIDLRFPGYEFTPIDSETGLPEGWATSSFLDVVDFVRGRSYTANNLVDDSAMKLVNLSNIAPFGGWLIGGEKSYAGEYKDDQIVQGGDIVMAVTDMTKERRLVGHIAIVPRELSGSLISMDLIKLKLKEMNAGFLYGQIRFSGISSMISMLANGTNVLHLKPEALQRVRILLPPFDLQDTYEEAIRPMLTAIDCTNEKIVLLSEARDRLLPKLISGEIEQ